MGGTWSHTSPGCCCGSAVPGLGDREAIASRSAPQSLCRGRAGLSSVRATPLSGGGELGSRGTANRARGGVAGAGKRGCRHPRNYTRTLSLAVICSLSAFGSADPGSPRGVLRKQVVSQTLSALGFQPRCTRPESPLPRSKLCIRRLCSRIFSAFSSVTWLPYSLPYPVVDKWRSEISCPYQPIPSMAPGRKSRTCANTEGGVLEREQGPTINLCPTCPPDTDTLTPSLHAGKRPGGSCTGCRGPC